MNRKERRAQESKTRQGESIATANRSAPMFDKVCAAEAKTVSDYLADKDLVREVVVDLMDNAIAFAAAFNENGVVACGAGCYYCCYQKVATTGIEVVHIAAFIREHYSAEDRAALMTALDAVTQERSPSGVNPARCPFLSGEGTCRIYEVRPLACRSVTSVSSEPCRAWQEEGKALGKVADKRRYTSHHAARLGLEQGIESHGYQGGFLDFHAALRLALSDDESVARWYRGERPFASATIPPRTHRLLPVL